MKTWSVLLVAALLAGCAGATPVAPTSATPTATPTSPDGSNAGSEGGTNGTTPGGTPPALVPVTLAFTSGYKLTPVDPGATVPEGSEPETLDPVAFWGQTAGQSITLSPWAADPAPQAMEIVGDMTLRVKFTASAAARETNPRAGGFPPAGGWIGASDSLNLFFLVNSVPADLAAGTVYEYEQTISLPEGGFFLRPGDKLSPNVWLAYRTADGTPVRYVTGGEDFASLSFRARNVTLPPLTEMRLVDQRGEMGPHPGFSTSGNPDAVTIPLELPPNTAYVVIESDGAPVVPNSNADLDVDVVAGGTVVLGGHGPTSKERIVIGPGNIAAHGRSLSLHASAASTGGSTWSIVATAFLLPVA